MVGPRQTGKTTVVLQALESLKIPKHFASTDEPGLAQMEWLRNEWEQARSLAQNGEIVLVIDEIQKK